MIIQTAECDSPACKKQFQPDNGGFAFTTSFDGRRTLHLSISLDVLQHSMENHYCGKECLIKAISEAIDQLA